MAYVTSLLCYEGGESFMGNPLTGDHTCGKCLTEIANKKKEEYFAKLAEMTLEERVSKLEEDAYNRAFNKPMYVPPPVY